jgi:ankyrin repeat protein
LNIAASVGSGKIIQFLLEKGGAINNDAQGQDYYETPLVSAARSSQLAVFEYLLDRGAVLDADGIDFIASKSEVRVISILLSRGMSVNTKTSYGNRSLLHLSAKTSIETTELLLKQGADVNIIDNYGKTPIFEATNKQMVQLLISYGANVNVALPHNNMTPLHFHASSSLALRRKEIIDLLLNVGANMYAEKTEGETPLHVAAHFGDLELVQLFAQWGMPVDLRSSVSGETPLHSACKASGTLPVVKYLISLGVNILTRDANGRVPLHYAAMHGHSSTVKYLLQCGSPADIFDSWVETPLQKAVAHPYGLDAVQHLIAYGADVNRADSAGQSPVFVAFKNKNKKNGFTINSTRSSHFAYAEAASVMK